MDKDKAAEFVGVSTRALERYGTQKMITPKKIRVPKVGMKSDYAIEDLIALRKKLYGDADVPPTLADIEPPVLATEITDHSPESDNPIEPSGTMVRHVSPALAKQLPKPLAKSGGQGSGSIVPASVSPEFANFSDTLSASVRIVLTVPEVSLLTGFSPAMIKDALRAGELKGKLIKNKWRVQRTAVEDWANTLFADSDRQ